MIIAHALMTYFRSNQSSSWLQSTELIEHTINKSKDEVQQVIEDLERYGKFHPLITNVEKINDGNFKVKERPYSWLPISIGYRVFVEELTAEKAVYGFSSLVWFKPKFTYRLESQSLDTTKIQLAIRIEGPPIGRQILINKMVAAQLQLWQAFEQSLNN